jgi:hypothetical protein
LLRVIRGYEVRVRRLAVRGRPARAAIKVEPKVEPEIAPTFWLLSVRVLKFQGKERATREQKPLERQQFSRPVPSTTRPPIPDSNS